VTNAARAPTSTGNDKFGILYTKLDAVNVEIDRSTRQPALAKNAAFPPFIDALSCGGDDQRWGRTGIFRRKARNL